MHQAFESDKDIIHNRAGIIWGNTEARPKTERVWFADTVLVEMATTICNLCFYELGVFFGNYGTILRNMVLQYSSEEL